MYLFAKAKVKKLSSQIGNMFCRNEKKTSFGVKQTKKHRILNGEKPEEKKLSRGRVNIA